MLHKDELDDFKYAKKITTKGSLAIVLQLTRAFSKDELPIDPTKYVTEKQGQVAGLGGGNLEKILAEHGITRQLAKEGGRTSRGGMGIMLAYADLINGFERPVDFTEIEDFWIRQVRVFFAGRPFKLPRDSSRSVADAVNELLEQTEKRQKENPGTHYKGTVLQHLVAAKLEYLMPTIEIHGASDADDQTGREGDFIISDTAIHCTTMPGDLLMKKCVDNLHHGLNPIIVTIADSIPVAHALLKDSGIANRVEVWDLEQFLSTNVFEHGRFDSNERKNVLAELIKNYNGIIDEFETDPSLKIEYDL